MGRARSEAGLSHSRAGSGGAGRGLILASRSPQRRAILRQLGVSFSVQVPDVQEVKDGPPEEVAVENARRKAHAVAESAADALVLGADTIVCLDGRTYGKPDGPEQAQEMLETLSGRVHAVIGGICLLQGGRAQTAAARTEVRFRALSGPLIRWYVESGEWAERAGSYAIQGRGAALVAAIDGDYLNVVGLSVVTLLELMPGLIE
ncbi:MAG: Maf family protein [Solirubrobacteraceae bacterium]